MYISEIDFGTPSFDQLIALRDEILRKPLGMEFSVEDIAKEYDQIHLGCFDDDHCVVGVLVLKHVNSDSVKMRQVAVSEHCQSKGIGKFMVQASEEVAKLRNYKKIELSARSNAIPFYDKQGYQKVGDLFQEVGIDHFKMVKEL